MKVSYWLCFLIIGDVSGFFCLSDFDRFFCDISCCDVIVGVKIFFLLLKFLFVDCVCDDEIFIKDKIEFVFSYIIRILY